MSCPFQPLSDVVYSAYCTVVVSFHWFFVGNFLNHYCIPIHMISLVFFFRNSKVFLHPPGQSLRGKHLFHYEVTSVCCIQSHPNFTICILFFSFMLTPKTPKSPIYSKVSYSAQRIPFTVNHNHIICLVLLVPYCNWNLLAFLQCSSHRIWDSSSRVISSA